MLKTRFIFCFLVVSSFISVQLTSQNQYENKGGNKIGWEVIRDTLFEKGVAISPLHPSIVQEKGSFEKANTDTFYFEKRDVLPVWQLSQWHSKYDFAKALPVRDEAGSIEYSNKGKRIVRYVDGALLLDITTSTEYNKPRKDGEDWPHLLIEQTFEKKPNIGKARELIFSMALRLVKSENKMKKGEFNESFHTAQSPFYFILKNTNEQSEDFNKSIWLGIPSFDYRYTMMNENELISWDIGTNMYIYNVPQTLIWGNISFQDMEWHTTRTDILPLIKQAVESMKSKNLFLLTSLSDLELVGMNFGWEVPGTFDAAILVKGISLKVID
ncbi:MAG: hypothetical protein ACK5KT_09860 [Dysgonomonas sp.]